MTDPHSVSCNEVVELATGYLEGVLGGLEAAVDEHAEGCPGCRAYLDQMRQVVRMLGAVSREEVPPDVLAVLLDDFRQRHS